MTSISRNFDGVGSNGRQRSPDGPLSRPWELLCGVPVRFVTAKAIFYYVFYCCLLALWVGAVFGAVCSGISPAHRDRGVEGEGPAGNMEFGGCLEDCVDCTVMDVLAWTDELSSEESPDREQQREIENSNSGEASGYRARQTTHSATRRSPGKVRYVQLWGSAVRLRSSASHQPNALSGLL